MWGGGGSWSLISLVQWTVTWTAYCYTPMNEKSIIWTFISEFLNISIIQSRTKFRGEEGRAIFYIVLLTTCLFGKCSSTPPPPLPLLVFETILDWSVTSEWLYQQGRERGVKNFKLLFLYNVGNFGRKFTAAKNTQVQTWGDYKRIKFIISVIFWQHWKTS